MIAPDANLLIYAYTPREPFHRPAVRWLEGILSDMQPVGIPILSIYAFLRVVTNPRATPAPVAFRDAADVVDQWLERPHVRVLYPGDRHWQILGALASEVTLRGAQVTDAAIAAIALEYGATIHTNDRDFARFPGLRWLNPLQKS